MEEYFKELSRTAENGAFEPTFDDGPTGLEEMGEELETQKKKEAHEKVMLAEFMDKESIEPSFVVKEKKERKRSPDEKIPEETKGPLTTFGHSSRPRRSVNYASIERGDEAQSQSLVTQFSTGKKKTKRTRDELDENYEVSFSQKRKPYQAKKRAPAYLPNTVIPGPSMTAMTIELPREEEFLQSAPSVSAERPGEDSRTVGKVLDDHIAVRRSSGGFRRFVAWLSDTMILGLISAVERKYIVTADSEDKRLIRSIRHVYNSMSEGYRRDWEYAAKMQIFESRIFTGGVVSMPISEIVTREDREPPFSKAEGSSVRPDCCALRPLVDDMKSVAEHYLQEHDVVHLYGCDICHKVFTSRFELTKHECNEFATFLLEKSMKGESLELEAAYMFLCCSQCGLWLPVKTSTNGMKGWNYFATALVNHACEPMVAVVVYFPHSLPDEGKSVRMSFQFMCSVSIGFPMSCSECEISEFQTVQEADEHFKIHNTEPEQKHTCNKCGSLEFGTDYMNRHHQLTHIAQSAQFANYLTYSATYHPPPNSGRSPHIGFKTQIPAIGGCQANEMALIETIDSKEEEFVEPNENVIAKKLTRWKRVAPRAARELSADSDFSAKSENLNSSSSGSESSSDEDFTNKKSNKMKKEKEVRGDLGYEHIKRAELLGRSEEEQEAVEKCEKVFQKKFLDVGEHLKSPEEVMRILGDCEAPFLGNTGSKFADELAKMTMKTVNLPASNCIDPLKDLLLVNKIFLYCPTCKMVLSSDPRNHLVVCGTQEEDLIELFHPACGPHHGIRCIDPECGKNFCSVTSLRNHCALYHNLNVHLELTVPQASSDLQLAHRYDRSMMLLAKHFAELQADTRTLMARFTDVECFMPFSGFLEPRVKIPLDFGMRKMPRLAPLRPGLVPIAPKPEENTVKPYKIPRTSRWFSCTWCTREFEQNSEFTTHLIRTHMYPCQYCGKCYASVGAKRAHGCDQAYRGDARGANLLAGGCAVCKERFSIDLLFAHYIRRHFSSIEFDPRTGEMFPAAVDLQFEPITAHHTRYANGETAQFERTDYRLKLIKIMSSPVYGVTLHKLTTRTTPPGLFSLTPPDVKNVDARLMCYLCELTFDDGNELSTHMDEAHAERWSNCPFCEAPVASHFELQSHLLHNHTKREGGRVLCEFCKEGHQRFMASHLLFRCKKKPCCTICGQRNTDPAVNYIHMKRSHSNTFKRFQCAFCSIHFVSMGDYYEHTCTLQQNRVYACICQPDLYFPSVNQFCDHFDSVHVERNACKICHIDAPSQENLARHRMSHVKAEAMQKAPRQVFITEKLFFPKETSAYVRWQRGGPMPPCYRAEPPILANNRSNLGRVVYVKPTPPTSGSAPTLFDVLEGPLSANPANSRNGTLQPATRINKPTFSSDEVIELSEDDDEENDDLDVVFESSRKSGSPEDNQKNGTSAVPTQISSQIRVEQSGDGYGGHQQPGYVVDDEMETVETTTTQNEPVHKEIVDENGDDELAVVAEVENASGTLQSSITSRREKTLKCPKCSELFLTNAARQKHIEGHKQDAGNQLCGETYGMPVDSRAFLCRNCCIAFEDQQKYRRHIAIHGDTVHPCQNCSGIAFNQATITNHMAAHVAKQVNYGCGTCLLKFSSDLALMAHLGKKHDVQLFYFCKICGLGATDANVVFEHLTSHLKHSYSLMQRFGACPIQLLNYEPADEKDFRMRVKANMIQLVEPSDCSHRTMLLSNETVLSCKTCHCTQPWFNYLAFNGYTEDKSLPHFRLIEPDKYTPFPLSHQLSTVNAQNMLRYGNSSNVSHRSGRLVHAPTVPAISGARKFNNGIPPHRTPISQRPVPQAPIVTVTANGARVIRPAPRVVIQNQQQQIQQQNNNITARRVIVTKAGATTTAKEGRVLQVRPTIDGNRCGDCNKTFSNAANDFDRHLHKMHQSTDSWLCRQCGHSGETELQLFLHYVNEHLRPAYQQNQARAPQFKANVFKLRCPVSACKEAEFMSAKTFQRHMASHPVLLPHCSENCDARFATKQLRMEHDKKHHEFLEENGTDATCCPICGTFDMWSLPKDAETDCLQSHIIRHGLDYRSGCRCCLQQFPADVNLSAVLKHILDAHSHGAQLITCQICGETDITGIPAFRMHCEKRHVFHMLLKPIRSTRGELVVTTGLEFQSFTGLKQANPITATQASVGYRVQRAEPTSSSQEHQGNGQTALLTIAAAIGEQEPMEGIEEQNQKEQQKEQQEECDDDDEIEMLD